MADSVLMRSVRERKTMAIGTADPARLGGGRRVQRLDQGGVFAPVDHRARHEVQIEQRRELCVRGVSERGRPHLPVDRKRDVGAGQRLERRRPLVVQEVADRQRAEHLRPRQADGDGHAHDLENTGGMRPERHRRLAPARQRHARRAIQLAHERRRAADGCEHAAGADRSRGTDRLPPAADSRARWAQPSADRASRRPP